MVDSHDGITITALQMQLNEKRYVALPRYVVYVYVYIPETRLMLLVECFLIFGRSKFFGSPVGSLERNLALRRHNLEGLTVMLRSFPTLTMQFCG